MKKSLLLLCAVLFARLLSADAFEKQYGRGVVHIETDSLFIVEFFSGPDAEMATHRVSIMRDAWNIGTHYVYFDSINTADSLPKWFSALYFIPTGEYARIDIPALDSSNGYYRTILKDDKGRDVWVKQSNHATFLSWFGFYCTVSSIEPVSEGIVLYESPNDQAQQLDFTHLYPPGEHHTMRPLEVQFFWMKVEIQYPDPDPQQPWHVYTGWIKWRDEKQMLVKYNLMGC